MSNSLTRTVLFVDDAPEEAEFFADYFSRDPAIRPVTACSDDEAFAAIEKAGIDCVVSDSIHASNGKPFVEVLHRMYPALPVVLYSGRPPESLPTDVADGYLQKGTSADTASTLGRLGQRIHTLAAGMERSDTRPAGTETRSWTRLGRFDWTGSNPASATIVQALVEQTELSVPVSPRLHDLIDPDSLDALMRHGANRDANPPVTISFVFNGYLLRVQSDGTVEYWENPKQGERSDGKS